MPSKTPEFLTEDVELASFLIAVGAGKFRGLSMISPNQARFVFRPAPTDEATAKFLRDEPVGARTLFSVKRNLINQVRQAKVNGNRDQAVRS